jgi:hypothetical protein
MVKIEDFMFPKNAANGTSLEKMLACYRRVLMKKMKKFKDWDFIL